MNISLYEIRAGFERVMTPRRNRCTDESTGLCTFQQVRGLPDRAGFRKLGGQVHVKSVEFDKLDKVIDTVVMQIGEDMWSVFVRHGATMKDGGFDQDAVALEDDSTLIYFVTSIDVTPLEPIRPKPKRFQVTVTMYARLVIQPIAPPIVHIRWATSSRGR